MIHPTAIIAPTARIGKDVSIGAYSIVMDNAVIGDGTKVETHVVIDVDTEIGKNCRIFHHATLGSPPQDLKYNNEKTKLIVGDYTVIREYADLNRGTTASGKTVVGSHVLIMAYAHLGHDCRLGDGSIIANAVNLAGHVEIDHDVIVGGMVPVHQFVKIGAYSIIGGGRRVPQDVPPFVTAGGDPLSYKGLNFIGLQRKGFSSERIAYIKKIYRILFQSGLNISKAIERIENEIETKTEDYDRILSFVKSSKRGLIYPFKRKKR